LPRLRPLVAAAAVALVGFALCVLAPVRQTSGDAAAGRLGALELRCGGDFDLGRYDLIAFDVRHGRAPPYYVALDESGQYTSIFGPAPSIVGVLGLVDVTTGDHVSDHGLRVRARGVAAALVALAAALLVLAASARVKPSRAAFAGLVAVGSFAGAATLGQDLWQATVAIPPLLGALALIAWRDKWPRMQTIVPALLVLAVMIRPTIVPLAVVLGVDWVLRAGRRWRVWLIAAAVAMAAIAPLVWWNVVHLASPLPVAQWNANATATEHVFSLTHWAIGLAGLLVSPARGLVWFAPIAVVGIVAALRARDRDLRVVGIAIVSQIVVVAAFYKWHGGDTFGPRLVAEAAWLAIWVALGTRDGVSRLALATSVLTVAVGVAGLVCFDPDQWETRRVADVHPDALWDLHRLAAALARARA
jgi:hypothetical protein